MRGKDRLDSDIENVYKADVKIYGIEYVFRKILGKGAYGTTFLVEKDGKLIAIKELIIDDEVNEININQNININKKSKRNLIENEIDILKTISQPCHPFLVCYLDTNVYNNTIFIEMEYIDGINIWKFFDILRGDRNFYKYTLAALKDLSSALEYLHEKNILHRDIKPDNILITGKYYEICPKLIDVGLSCMIHEICKVELFSENKDVGELKEFEVKEVKCCKDTVGSPLWSAPETLLLGINLTYSDMFSLAATFYTFIEDGYLYPTYFKKVEQIKKFMNYEEYPKLNTTSETLNLIVNRLLEKDALNRLSAQEVLSILKR